MSKRNASHAGSWYSSSRKDLGTQLQNWLDKAEQKGGPSRAIIAPHAGYTYCGACGAHAYRQIPSQQIKRIFVLGPSHHVSLPGCALTQTSVYETPLYDVKIDKEINDELLQTGLFDLMSLEADEDEHSIEMQLPYLAKAMESAQGDFTVVPILVGSTNPEKEETYGRILSKYMDDPSNFFIISSDFCHWGKRFRYTYYDKKYKHIYQSIEALDKMGMDLIEQLDVDGFQKYLSTYGNTICGRHPIGIFLNTIQAYRLKNPTCKASFQFHSYAQSNRCRESGDSSVSYAAGSLTLG